MDIICPLCASADVRSRIISDTIVVSTCDACDALFTIQRHVRLTPPADPTRVLRLQAWRPADRSLNNGPVRREADGF